MILYFDTSAITKYFQEENGSAEVISLIDDISNTVWVSELANIEFLSTVHRKFRMGEINHDTLAQIITGFKNKVDDWNVEPFSALQTEEASRIISEYGKSAGIRTLDALHLAAYNLLKQDTWTFVVADRQLNNIAMLAGIKTIFIQ